MIPANIVKNAKVYKIIKFHICEVSAQVIAKKLAHQKFCYH